ncbi:MAG: type II toxin-antitoxin system PemK/MazF family toxin [Patescibacteria group bacterium]
MKIQTGYLYLANLNPTFGSEINKERPILVIQKESTIRRTVIILPISSKKITQPKIERLLRKDKTNNLYADSIVILDQIRAIDTRRLIGEIGKIDLKIYNQIISHLKNLF